MTFSKKSLSNCDQILEIASIFSAGHKIVRFWFYETTRVKIWDRKFNKPIARSSNHPQTAPAAGPRLFAHRKINKLSWWKTHNRDQNHCLWSPLERARFNRCPAHGTAVELPWLRLSKFKNRCCFLCETKSCSKSVFDAQSLMSGHAAGMQWFASKTKQIWKVWESSKVNIICF